MSDDHDGFTPSGSSWMRGPIHYREAGDRASRSSSSTASASTAGSGTGPPRALAGDHRCIVPDWPMGSHAEAMHAAPT